MSTLCPTTIGLDKDEQFQKVKETYKDRGFNDYLLQVYLQVYREREDLPIDWMPVNEDDFKGFTNYLNEPAADNSKNEKITAEYLNKLYDAMSTLYPNTAVMNRRLDLISRFFRTRVDRIVHTNGGSRTSAIRSQAKADRNGFQSIMDDVFSMIESLSTVEGQKRWYESRFGSTENLSKDILDWLEYRAKEFSLMSENKEMLAGLAAPRIASNEGISVNMDGLTYSFSEKETIEDDDTFEEQDEEGIDTEEAEKGDRYVDFRTLSLSSTLSTEAKNLIEKIWRRDVNGNVVYDDLGYPVSLDVRQTAGILHRVLRNSSPRSMLSDIENSVDKYPSLKGLVEHLRANPEDRGIIYCNFKKAHSTYYYGTKTKDGSLDVSRVGSASSFHSLSREAGTNISAGITSDKEYSIVTNDGGLITDGVIRGDDRYTALSKMAKTWNLDSVSALLEGVGFNVGSEDLKTVLASYDENSRTTGLNASGDRVELSYEDAIREALCGIYDRAKGIISSGDDVTGSHLFNYARDYFAKIADVLSPLQQEDAEERVRSNSKSMAANINPNALHQMMAVISNAKKLSPQEYERVIMREYGQYEGFGLGFDDSIRLTGWFSTIGYNNWWDAEGKKQYPNSKPTEPEFRPEDFRVVDMTDSQKVEYAKLSDSQHMINSYVMYMRGGKGRIDNNGKGSSGRMYEIPIQSDYETAYNFIVAPSYTYKQLVEKLAQEVECEAQRITAIKERRAADKKKGSKEPTRAILLNYEKRGLEFQIFPELNTNGFAESYGNAIPTDAHNEVLAEVDEQLKKLLSREIEKLKGYGLLDKDNIKLMGQGSGWKKNTFSGNTSLPGISSAFGDSVASWVLNSFFARQQFTKLMYGGLEHFKSTADFEKRSMYSHATRLPLYTEAKYKGKMVGKENQRVLYLSDDESRSAVYAQIVNSAEQLKAEGKITPDQCERMKKAYESITTTDGQGIRTLDSLREVKIMSQLWTEADETAYNNIKSKNYGPEDVEHFITGIKPIYTGYEIIPAQPGTYQKPIRVPVLHKYSEMVLLPDLAEGVSLQNDTVPFKSLNKINEKLGEGNKIDLFIFGSGVKIGGHSLIDAFAKDDDGNRILKDAESVSDFVVEKVSSGDFWVHTLPFKYYGIAASIHADIVDNNIAWASQAEKEAWANILPGEKLTIAGQEMESASARELYNKIKEARVIDSFKKLKDVFLSNHKIATILKEELASRTYQSRETLFALQLLDGNDAEALPLFTPSIQHDVTALLSSILRKRLTKFSTKGANILQTSGFGMDMDASSFDETDALKDKYKIGVKFDDNGDFLYVETIVPIHDSRLEQFADDNGNISPERLDVLVKEGKIPESILNFIAYRTPSDAEHSVIPCRIKGFVANVAGATIRLPKEIMVMTGHDYDGDKLRCHFKDFSLGWNEDQIHRDYEKFSNTEAVQAILADEGDTTMTPYEVFSRNAKSDTNPDAGKYRIVKDIEYDYTKTPLQNIGKNSDYSALNNALVDLMFAQLTSKNGSLKMFIPGGNAETTINAYTMHIIKAFGEEDGKERIANALKVAGLSDKASDTTSLYNYLMQQSKSKLSKVIDIIDNGDSPFSVSHSIASHRYMMDGAGMIGVYAVYNSGAAMLQRLNLSYNSLMDIPPVKLFGKVIQKLYPILSNGSFSTLGMSRLLNAAVDNGKDPVLGYLNQTSELAPMTNFLFAAGLSEEEVHLLMNQPAVVELAKRMRVPNAPGFVDSANTIIEELLKKCKEGTQLKRNDAPKFVAEFVKERFIENLDKSYTSLLSMPEQAIKNQIEILQTLQILYKGADDLDTFIKLTRPESSSGGIDATVGGTIAKVIQLDNFRERIEAGDVTIPTANSVIEYRKIYENTMTSNMIDDAIGNELPEVVALNTLMKDGFLKMFRKWFPHTRESWLRTIRRVAEQYTYKKVPGTVVERISNDMILWKLLSNTAFVTGNPEEEQSRILREVPKQLEALKKRVYEAKDTDKVAKALSDNVFLSNLDLGATIGENNEEVKRIRFMQNGSSIENTADDIRSGWNELYRIKETRQLALDLFKYNMYTNGLSFGQYEFSHYAPFSVIQNIPGYQKAMRDILKSSWDEDEENNFYHQYCMNHWGDKNFLVKIDSGKIPMELRGGIKLNAKSSMAMTVNNFKRSVFGLDYIIVSDESSDNDILCRIVRGSEDNIIELQRAQKLGIRNRYGQVLVQYNPTIRDYNEVRPVFTSNKVAWDSKKTKTSRISDEQYEATRQNAIDDIPFDTSLFNGSNIRKVEELAETAVAANSNATKDNRIKWDRYSTNGYEVSSAGKINLDTGDSRFSARNATFRPNTIIFGHDVSGRTIESVYQNSVKQGDWSTDSNDKTGAPKSNAIIKGNSEDDSYRDGYLPLWKEWARQNPELIEELRRNLKGRVLTDKYASTHVSQARALAEILNSGYTDTSSGKLSAEQSALLGFDDNMFYLVERDEHGNPIMKGYPKTPGVVARARDQKVFVELNKKLRKILEEHNVPVQVIEDAEARLGAAGVTEFMTPRVLAEGFRVMVRLANDESGEWALPEEFAHIALEMLGKHSVTKDDAGNIANFHHENALVERLLNALNTDNKALDEAYDGLLEKYEELYGKDNREKLIVEAAGKLVAKQLFLQQKAKTPSIKNLITRVIDAIKRFFKQFNPKKVDNEIFDAENISSQLAKDLLSGRLADEMSLDKITNSDTFYSVDKDLSDKSDILSKMKKTTAKRIDILQRRVKYSLGKGRSSKSLEETKKQLDKLEKQEQDQKLETTVVDYLKDAMSFMSEMEKSLDETINNKPANSVCRKLRITRDSLYSFASVIEDVRAAIESKEIKDDVNVEQAIRDVSDQLEKFWQKYNRISVQYFELFLSNVYGKDGVTINVGRQKGRHISIHDMATKADHDVSFLSRMLNAVSDIDDFALQAIDDVTRDAKMNARERVRGLRPRLEAAMAALVKEQGNRDQSFMFERVKKGNKLVRTGRYISAEDAKKLSPAQQHFYTVFMDIKKQADTCLPEALIAERKMIMFRKEHYERMNEAQGIQGKTTEEWEAAKRSVLEMGDVDFENEQVIKDFEGNIVDQLPLKFLNKAKTESFDDMTEDAATSLMAYTGMAFEYGELNNVIGILENARYASSLRDVTQKRGIKTLVEKVGSEKDYHYMEPFTVKQARTNLQKATDDYFQMHVYGHLRKDEGTIGKTRISKRKLVDTLNRFSSLSQMALNLHQRIANINTGFTQIIVESAGGRIKAKDVAWASAIWLKEAGAGSKDNPARLVEVGKTDYANKLSLWMDKFDIHQDNGRDAQTTKYGRTNVSRVFNQGLLYAGLSIGEDFLAGTSALALARNYKMKGPDGKPANLWDAYEVKYTNNLDKTGAYLELKKGYTKEDGSELTFEDEKKFAKEVIGTNFELQGIYNTDDRSAIQQHSLGALAIMYRKWIAPAMKRRYAGVQYSKLKDNFTEGYYRTSLRFLGDTAKDWFAPVSEEESEKTVLNMLTDIKALKNAILLNWNKMNDYERSNCKKAAREMGVVVCLFVASALLTKLPPDDHDDNKFLAWADDIAITQLLRLRSEIGSQAPTPNMLNEGLRILSSPFAAMRPLTDSLNIFQLMWPTNYFETVQSGRYKGRTKAHKYFMKLPVVSMFRKLDNFVDPSTLISYYKNQNY